MFERIESEWPLFFCYLIIDFCIQGNMEEMRYYVEKLEKVSLSFSSSV